MNPFEMIWAVVKQRVYGTDLSKNLEVLRNKNIGEWTGLDQEIINNRIYEVPSARLYNFEYISK